MEKMNEWVVTVIYKVGERGGGADKDVEEVNIKL